MILGSNVKSWVIQIWCRIELWNDGRESYGFSFRARPWSSPDSDAFVISSSATGSGASGFLLLWSLRVVVGGGRFVA